MKDSMSGLSIGAFIVLIIFMYMLCKDNENMTKHQNMTDDSFENVTREETEDISLKQWRYLYNNNCEECKVFGTDLVCYCTKSNFAPYEMSYAIPHENYAIIDLTKCKKPYTFDVKQGAYNENITVSCMK